MSTYGNCACDSLEWHPVSECIPPGQTNDETFTEDVRALAVALGLGDHARPYSAHAVVHRELLPAIRSLPLPECPTLGVCPNCRVGWGHFDGKHYLPTEESRAANRPEAAS